MDERIGYLLKRAQAGLRLAMDEALAPKGLTTPQYSVLSALELEPGISNAELARRAFVTPQTMIRIVANLETLRLIARQPHPTNGRVLTASLTPEGARLIASCHSLVGAVEARMLRAVSARERATLHALLERCATALDGGGA